jgi:hypothetical protein
MSFKDPEATEALVASGRHCCICHRFAGIKIELHHIVLSSEGGDNSFDNCIPLCFDCHADMRSYDHKHPKGKKYTHTELKMHRNNWYEKVKNHSFQKEPNNKEGDINLYFEIRAKITINTIEFIANHSFGNDFLRSRLDSVFEYADMMIHPDDEFFDQEMETARAEFRHTIREFAEIISTNTFRDERDERISTPNRGMKYNNHEKYYDTVEKMNKLAAKTVEAYHALIRTARRRLGVRMPKGET